MRSKILTTTVAAALATAALTGTAQANTWNIVAPALRTHAVNVSIGRAKHVEVDTYLGDCHRTHDARKCHYTIYAFNARRPVYPLYQEDGRAVLRNGRISFVPTLNSRGPKPDKANS